MAERKTSSKKPTVVDAGHAARRYRLSGPALMGGLALVSMVLGGSAAAQTVPGGSRAEVLRLPPNLQAAASDFGSFSCPAGGIAALNAGETPVAVLVGLRLEGVSVLNAATLPAEWAGIVGQQVSREALGRVASRVECRYREAGYLFAKAAVRADPPATGSYVISLEEGRLGGMEVQTADPVLARLVLRAFSAIEAGKPLNASAVRRGLANAAALGVSDIRPTIRRSRSEPGSIDLILVVASPSDQVFGQISNYGTEPLGPYGISLGARVFGLTPFGDRTLLGVYSSSDGREQKSVQFQSDVLLNGKGLAGQLTGAYALANPGAELGVLDIKARTQLFGVEISQPLIIRRGLVATGYAGLESIDQTTNLFSTFPLSRDHLRVATAGVRADGLLHRGIWRANGEIRKGLELRGASRAGDLTLSRAEADPQASFVRGEAQFQTLLPKGALGRATLRGQWSGSALSSFEQFSFGAVNGGPGLAPGAVSGDSGLALMLAVDGPSYRVRPGITLQPTLQFATVNAWNQGARLADDARATIAAAGFKVGLGGRVVVDVLLAEPLDGLTQVASGAAGSKIMVRMTTALDWTPGAAKQGRGR